MAFFVRLRKEPALEICSYKREHHILFVKNDWTKLALWSISIQNSVKNDYMKKYYEKHCSKPKLETKKSGNWFVVFGYFCWLVIESFKLECSFVFFFDKNRPSASEILDKKFVSKHSWNNAEVMDSKWQIRRNKNSPRQLSSLDVGVLLLCALLCTTLLCAWMKSDAFWVVYTFC